MSKWHVQLNCLIADIIKNESWAYYYDNKLPLLTRKQNSLIQLHKTLKLITLVDRGACPKSSSMSLIP